MFLQAADILHAPKCSLLIPDILLQSSCDIKTELQFKTCFSKPIGPLCPHCHCASCDPPSFENTYALRKSGRELCVQRCRMPQTTSACSEGNTTSSIQESEGIQTNHTKANCLAQSADADETGSDECDECDEWVHVFAEQWQRHQYESYFCRQERESRQRMYYADWSRLKMLWDSEQELKNWWITEQEKQCA